MMDNPATLQVKNAQPETIVKVLKDHLIAHSLPLWAARGWDAGRGGFIEGFFADGTPDLETARRVRVQARQIYTFAKAAQIGWYPEGGELALKGLDYMLRKAGGPDGRPGYVHLLNRDGSTKSDIRDSYDHAFVLLALGTVFALTKDAQVRSEIDRVLRFVDQNLRSQHGGIVEGLPPSLPRRQNPHMHMFEAMIALYEATGEPQFQNRAGDFFGLFVANLFDEQTQTLGEYFEEDWAAIKPGVVEPGHQAEWVWLLRGFERNTGCPTARFRSALLKSALRYRDQASGCLVDEGDPAGRTTRTTRRLWPQTEIAKAWIAQAETEEEGAEAEAKNALVRLYDNYLNHPVVGCWYDQFDEQGRSLVQFVPASSFYHILCAASEAEAVLQ